MFRFGQLIIAAITLASTGCIGFERDWRDARHSCFPTDDIAGLWEGTWCSHTNGHNGSLRAIITRDCNGCYHAQFKATFLEVVPFGFEMPLGVSRNGDVHSLDGSADLGLLAGGVYRYSGEANACHFVANYCAKSDHGVFNMTRVATCCDSGCCDQGCDGTLQDCTNSATQAPPKLDATLGPAPTVEATGATANQPVDLSKDRD
ncbi:MAG: hypothetical protein O3A00_14735 [Planctomycetota bacterium]|nr:hypothetical protein [Planctomycetota bacterium]